MPRSNLKRGTAKSTVDAQFEWLPVDEISSRWAVELDDLPGGVLRLLLTKLWEGEFDHGGPVSGHGDSAFVFIREDGQACRWQSEHLRDWLECAGKSVKPALQAHEVLPEIADRLLIYRSALHRFARDARLKAPVFWPAPKGRPPANPRARSNKTLVQARAFLIELANGDTYSPALLEKELRKKFGISRDQARVLIQEVSTRGLRLLSRGQKKRDLPNR